MTKIHFPLRLKTKVRNRYGANIRVHVAKAQGIADKIKQAGGTAIAVPGDMLNAKHIDELVKKAAEFGSGKIHIIVNNAGFTWDGVIHKVSTSI